MSVGALSDGHDVPGLVDQPFPGMAAMIDDIAVGGKDPDAKPVFAEELHTVSTRLRSGERAGSGSRVMLAEITGSWAMCPLAAFENQHGVGAGIDAVADLPQMLAHAKVSQCGMTRPAPLPVLGHIAPKI